MSIVIQEKAAWGKAIEREISTIVRGINTVLTPLGGIPWTVMI